MLVVGALSPDYVSAAQLYAAAIALMRAQAARLAATGFCFNPIYQASMGVVATLSPGNGGEQQKHQQQQQQ
jgi:hypothetical protein